MICIHHNDLDGKCAAAIVARKYAGDNLKFIEMDYKDELDLSLIQKGELVVIVDFSLKPNVMAEVQKITTGIKWIDHHATAKDYPYQGIAGLRDFQDKSMAGCELTWKVFYPDLPAPLAVRLIGDYDKWALKMPNSKVFYEGMKLLKNGPEEEMWESLLSNDYMAPQKIIRAGETATLYRDNYCNGLCKAFGYETEIDGYKAYACNQYMFGSGGFGKWFNEYPLCIAYIHDGKKFTVSLYSETVDVGIIAKRYGGGGHKGASGFVCENLPFKKK